MGKYKMLVILIGVMVIASVIFSTTQVEAGKGEPKPVKCKTWDLAADYQLYPNQSNPSPDSCGTPDVWHYFRVDPVRQNYTLLDIYSYNLHGIPKMEQWATGAGVGYAPCAAINGTSEELIPPGYTIVWPAGAVNVHPAPTEFGAVGWRSPIDGYVMVDGFISDMDAAAGNGVRWYIDQNSTNLLSGELQNGGRETFTMNKLRVRVGDFLYVSIDPKDQDYGWDSTQLDIHIERYNPKGR